MAFVNITRAIPLYYYTPVQDPWFVHTHSKSCYKACASQPHCTGFSEYTLGTHCHLFYVPFCIFPYEVPEPLDNHFELIVAKSEAEPAEWKDGQTIATIPSARAVEIGPFQASISYTDANSATLTTESGSSPWEHNDLSCSDICLRATDLLGFECAVALLQRDEQNSRPILCNLHDASNVPEKIAFSPNDDIYLNTEFTEMRGCERNEEADRQAKWLKGRRSALDSNPNLRLPRNSATSRSRTVLLLSSLSIIVMSFML